MISQKEKQKIIEKYRIHESDSGSAAVQIAVLSARIEELTDHMKEHKKDFSSRRGLLRLVGRRRRLLNYLMKKDLNQYSQLIQKLGLRK